MRLDAVKRCEPRFQGDTSLHSRFNLAAASRQVGTHHDHGQHVMDGNALAQLFVEAVGVTGISRVWRKLLALLFIIFITSIITTNNIITMFSSPFHERKKREGGERRRRRREEEREEEEEKWCSVPSRCGVCFCRCSFAVHVFFYHCHSVLVLLLMLHVLSVSLVCAVTILFHGTQVCHLNVVFHGGVVDYTLTGQDWFQNAVAHHCHNLPLPSLLPPDSFT